MGWEGSGDAGGARDVHEVVAHPDGLGRHVLLAARARDVDPQVSARRGEVRERHPGAERVVDGRGDHPRPAAAAAGEVERGSGRPDRAVVDLERQRGEGRPDEREGAGVDRGEPVGAGLLGRAGVQRDELRDVLAPEDGLPRAARAAAGRDGRGQFDAHRAGPEAGAAADGRRHDVGHRAGVGHARVGGTGIGDPGVGCAAVGRSGVDGGDHDAVAGGAGRARAADPAAEAAVRVRVEHGLAAVGSVRVAVAEAGGADHEAARPAEAGGAVRVRPHRADRAARPAVAGVGRRRAAGAAAEGLARGAWKDAGAGRAALARGAGAAAGAAVGRVAQHVAADVAAGELTGRAGTAVAARAGLVGVAPPAAAAAVLVVVGQVEADRPVGRPAVGLARRAGRVDRPDAGAGRAALARGAGAAAGAAVLGAGVDVGLAAVEREGVAVAEARVAGEAARTRDAGRRGVRAHGAGVAAAAAVLGVGDELALAAVRDDVVAVAEARVAGVAAAAVGAGRVGLDVGVADAAAGAAVREVVHERDAGRAAGAAHEREAAVPLRAGELAAPVGADLADAAGGAAAAASALVVAGVDLAAVVRITVAVGVAREAGEAAGARRAGRRGVVARRAGRAAGAAAREARPGVGLAAVARGTVAVLEARGAREVAAAAEADRSAVRARRADVAARPAVGDLAPRVDLAAVALVLVAARRARGAGERRVDRDVDHDGHVGRGGAGVGYAALAGAVGRAVDEARLGALNTAGAGARQRLVDVAGVGRAGVGCDVDAAPARRGEEQAAFAADAGAGAVRDAHAVRARLVELAARVAAGRLDVDHDGHVGGEGAGIDHRLDVGRRARVAVDRALAAAPGSARGLAVAQPDGGNPVAVGDATLRLVDLRAAAERVAPVGRDADVAGVGVAGVGVVAEVRGAARHDGGQAQAHDETMRQTHCVLHCAIAAPCRRIALETLVEVKLSNERSYQKRNGEKKQGFVSQFRQVRAPPLGSENPSEERGFVP